MKKRIAVLVLALGMILSGCSNWMDGEYVSVTPFQEDAGKKEQQTVQVRNYRELMSAFQDMVADGVENCTISTPAFTEKQINSSVDMAIRHIMYVDPIGSFIVKDIQYDIGTSGGVAAIAVKIVYNNNRGELPNIKIAKNMEDVEKVLAGALNTCDAGVVMEVNDYRDMDFPQFVQDYADLNPDVVMEIPAVTVSTYPAYGIRRVVQVQFSYKTSRYTLRSMQGTVQPVFASARLYVSDDAEDNEKYSQLYSFLMERYQYKIETSITPSYSLLRHGVGDSKAFATVYAAMCQDVGLDCQVISGTRDGEAYFWNMIRDNEAYYHVDLLRSEIWGGFRELCDRDMEGYVWDYSAFPPCDTEPRRQEITEQTVPEESAEASEPTESSEPAETGQPEETTEETEAETAPSVPAETDAVPTEQNNPA